MIRLQVEALREASATPMAVWADITGAGSTRDAELWEEGKNNPITPVMRTHVGTLAHLGPNQRTTAGHPRNQHRNVHRQTTPPTASRHTRANTHTVRAPPTRAALRPPPRHLTLIPRQTP